MNKFIKLPVIGRLGVIREPSGLGEAIGQMGFSTNLKAEVFRNGKSLKAKDVMPMWIRFWNNIRSGETVIDLGSGLVTNTGVLAMANDWNWASPSGAAINTLALAEWHVSGTGTNAAAATDIKLQTQSTNGGQTPVEGTHTLVSAANLQKLQNVATIAYTGSEAVTEWGLICGSTISNTTGTPWTAGSATTGTVTATPLTASTSTVQGSQQTIFEDTNSATPHWGLCTSNTTSVVTVPAWYKTSDGTAAGTNPLNTETLVNRPVMWDRKQFSAINVVNGDSIQYTYTLTINSGG